MRYLNALFMGLLVSLSVVIPVLPQTVPNGNLLTTVTPAGVLSTGQIASVTIRMSGYSGDVEIDCFNFIVHFDSNILAVVPGSYYLGTTSGTDQQWLSKPSQESFFNGFLLTNAINDVMPGRIYITVGDLGVNSPEHGTLASSGFLISFQVTALVPGTSAISLTPYNDGSVLLNTFLKPVGSVQLNGTTVQVRDAAVMPTAAITSPAEGAVFNGPAKITISATASSSNASITNVAFFAEGTTKLGEASTAPYTINWSNPPSGPHTLTVVANDNYGGSAVSSPIHVTVNAPSSITITNPVNNARFTSPANITINTMATDSDGSIARVEFYSGGTLLGTDTNAPFAFTWNNVVGGAYSLTAKAVDNLGAVTVAAPVNITVRASNSPPHFVATGAILEYESGPVNGGIDIGETVRIRFCLKNDGGCDAANLVATLANSGGATSSSGANTYGLVTASGPSTSQPFTFTAAGTNGGSLTATLQLQDGTTSFGNLSYPFVLGSNTFSGINSSVIVIRDNTNATLYPSPISVAGLSGVVDTVTVTVNGINHTRAEHVDMLLVAPNGRTTMLMSDAGWVYQLTNVDLTFNDAGWSQLSTNDYIRSGTYRPSDYTPTTNDDVFLSPAPAGPYGKTLSALRGGNPNGTWSLYVMDDTYGDSGRINGGWVLNLSTFDPVSPVADLAVTVTDIPDPVGFGSNVTYTVTVTNSGPEEAWGVLLSNLVPAGMSFVSATPNAGSCSNASGTVICDFSNLASNATASVTLVATATNVGTKKFIARAYTSGNDFNQANNNVTNTTTVNAAANLGVALTVSPNPVYINNNLTYTITVTNGGPNDASSVTLTNVLPTGVSFVSAIPSQGSCSQNDGTVTCALGTVYNATKATITITGTSPGTASTLTNQAGVYSATADPVGTNDTASVAIANLNPAFIIVPAAAWLLSESGPVTGGVDPGETVSICFYLKNMGTASTTNLTATLLASGGVTAPSPGGAQSYGVLEANGWAVGRTNSFTASGTNGGRITATLQLQEGAINLGTVRYDFALGNQINRSCASPISIVDNGPANPYKNSIWVSGLNGVVTKATVTVSNLTHTYLADVNILLVGPSGQTALLLSDAGANSSAAALTLSFDDEASNSVPQFGTVAPGNYKPTDYLPVDNFTGSAPAGPYGTNLAVFNGLSPNGEWSLYVYDDDLGDIGQIAGGWTLNLITVGIINPASPSFSLVQITTNQQFQFVLNGRAGDQYLIQASTNLKDWTAVVTNIVDAFPAPITDSNSTTNSSYRFYRALWKP